MRFRGTSIRRKIGALLLVPLLALVALWAFATTITVNEARQLRTVASVADSLGAPAEDTIHAIQQERRQTLVHLGDPRRADALSALQETRGATDDAVADLTEQAAGGARGDLNDGADARLAELLTSLDTLESLRERVGSNTVSRHEALAAYNDVVDPGVRFLSALHLLEDVELDRHGRAVIGILGARESLSRQDALVAGALAAGRVTEDEVRAIGDRVAEREMAYGIHLPELPQADRGAFEEFWESGTGTALHIDERHLLAGNASAVPATQWDRDAEAALEELRALGAEARDGYQARVEPEADSVLVRAGIAAAVGTLAVLASLFVSLRVGRGLVRDLQTLSREAKEAAEVRLPDVMGRLEAGEHVDVETEAPRLEYGRDEVGQVGQSLNTLQRAAVSAAVKQSQMRRGVSDVFVNLARRNQVLLHRQLNLLDAMERRTEDADELAELFRLDHLTTRMRRHAEGLVILSGAAPARQWRKPVQLMDVVRAAVAEVEDYERIELRRMPALAVAGSAVADLTHLIAELLENATVFSPPHTAVQVAGERVPHGYTLEIHDRGLGMTPDVLREVNERLAEPQDFELSDTDRLGLFVVSRLAERLGVRVALRDSPYGGTTAVALIPGELLTETAEGSRERERLPERPAPPALLNGPVDGPVELEAPVGAAGLARRDREAAEPRRDAGGPPGHAPDECPEHTGPEHTGPEEPPAPLSLPQRRRTPVLVADHGRPVGRVPADLEHGRGPAPGHEPGDAPHDAPPGDPDPAADRPATTAAGLPRRVRRTPPAAAPDSQRAASPGSPADPERRADAQPTPLRPPPTGHPPDGTASAPHPGEGPARAGGHPDTDDHGTEPGLDPEEVRSRMAALQRGWRQGRQQTDTRGGETPPGPTP